MTELIKIENNNGKQAVSGRELHEFLKISRDFTTWMKKMISYGFAESIDYEVYTQSGENPLGGRPSVDYIMTLDMAKEISMLQSITAIGAMSATEFWENALMQLMIIS